MFLRFGHEICDSPWLGAFWCNSFEREVVHEVTQASPKFRCNPLGEWGDRVMQSWGLTHCSCFSHSVWGGRSKRLGGRSNHPGLIQRKFWFWPRSSGSMLALTRGFYGWNLGAFRVRLLRFSLGSLCSGEGAAPSARSNRPRPFRRKFDFAGSFSVSLFALIRGAF
jgi:hypothetical protein